MSSRRAGRLEHALPGIEDRPVAGAAAQVARQVVGELLAGGLRAGCAVALVAGGQRHHEARRAEAALRAVAVDHRALHRVQRVGTGRMRPAHRFEVLDREQRLAVERGQEADAGVDRPQAQAADQGGCGRRRCGVGQLGHDHGAGAAVALAAAFLGAGAARVLAQPVEHAACRCDAFHAGDLPAVHEADRSGVHRLVPSKVQAAR